MYDFVDKTDNLYSYTGNSHGTLVFSVMAGFIESEFIGTAPDQNIICLEQRILPQKPQQKKVIG